MRRKHWGEFPFIEAKTTQSIDPDIVYELSHELHGAFVAAGYKSWVEDIQDLIYTPAQLAVDKSPNASIVIIGFNKPITRKGFKKAKTIIRTILKDWGLTPNNIMPVTFADDLGPSIIGG